MTAKIKSPADDMVELLRELADAPVVGLSMQELSEKLDWTLWRVNERLCQLGSRISHGKVRVNSRIVIKYTLK